MICAQLERFSIFDLEDKHFFNQLPTMIPISAKILAVFKYVIDNPKTVKF